MDERKPERRAKATKKEKKPQSDTTHNKGAVKAGRRSLSHMLIPAPCSEVTDDALHFPVAIARGLLPAATIYLTWQGFLFSG